MKSTKHSLEVQALLPLYSDWPKPFKVVVPMKTGSFAIKDKQTDIALALEEEEEVGIKELKNLYFSTNDEAEIAESPEQVLIEPIT